jgi:hypothetical protein
MAEEISFDEYKKAHREMRAEEGTRGFLIHLDGGISRTKFGYKKLYEIVP